MLCFTTFVKTISHGSYFMKAACLAQYIRGSRLSRIVFERKDPCKYIFCVNGYVEFSLNFYFPLKSFGATFQTLPMKSAARVLLHFNFLQTDFCFYISNRTVHKLLLRFTKIKFRKQVFKFFLFTAFSSISPSDQNLLKNIITCMKAEPAKRNCLHILFF